MIPSLAAPSSSARYSNAPRRVPSRIPGKKIPQDGYRITDVRLTVPVALPAYENAALEARRER